MQLPVPWPAMPVDFYARSLPLSITTNGGSLRRGEMKRRITVITSNKTKIKTQVAIVT